MASGLIYDDEGNDVTMQVLSDAVDTMPVNPDCAVGKHQACAGDAWDEVLDAPTVCTCLCHEP
jgi:hypothetical protein